MIQIHYPTKKERAFMSFSADIRRFSVSASAAVLCLAFAVPAGAQSDVKSVTTTGRAAGTGVKADVV